MLLSNDKNKSFMTSTPEPEKWHKFMLQFLCRIGPWLFVEFWCSGKTEKFFYTIAPLIKYVKKGDNQCDQIG